MYTIIIGQQSVLHRARHLGKSPPQPHSAPQVLKMDNFKFNFFLHGFQLCIDIRIDPVLTALTGINLQCKTALTFVVYCIVLCATVYIRVETDLKRISKRFETCNNFEHDRNVFSAVSQPSESPGIDTCYEEGETGLIQVEQRRYGFNSVWTPFEIWLCVTVA